MGSGRESEIWYVIDDHGDDLLGHLGRRHDILLSYVLALLHHVFGHRLVKARLAAWTCVQWARRFLI